MITATDVWLRQLELLVNCPEIEIRGKCCREQIAGTVSIPMEYPFVRCEGRKVSEAFRFAEAYWILSGDNRLKTISPYAPSIAKFSDNQHVFQGAYGPKVTEQLRYAVDSLKKDVYTRQSVISIWRENPRDSKDIPCTLSLQFLIRDGLLHCVATMRSSDVWLGLPYDMFNFSCIANWVLLELKTCPADFDWYKDAQGISLGTLTINMGSSHLYSRNYSRAEGIVTSKNGLADDLSFGVVSLKEAPMRPDHFIEWLRTMRDRS